MSKRKVDKISTPTPTPKSFNSNFNSNSRSFNSNSNSGKFPEYQLQLQLQIRRFQLQFQLQLRSWPQPWSSHTEVCVIINTVTTQCSLLLVTSSSYPMTTSRWAAIWQYATCMMTPSNGNIFRATGHFCGEFTGPRWIPHTKASDAELWRFLWSASE